MVTLLSVEETSALLKVQVQTVRLWAKQRRFISYKLGGRLLIDQADVFRFVREHKRERSTVEAGDAV